MAFRHGKSTKVLVNAYDLSQYFADGSPSESVETAETTAYGQNAKTYIVGLRDSTLSLSGFYDGDANAVDEVITASLQGANSNITFAPEGLAAGSRVITMESIETSYEISSPVADVVSVSVEGQTTDRIDRGISLVDIGAVTATGNATSQDNTAATSSGAAATVHVTANSRNGNTTFKVQHSADNATWVDLITFSVVPLATKTSERIAITGTVNRYTRIAYTLAGTTGSITFHANIARR